MITQRICGICGNSFGLLKSGQRKYCLNCKYTAKLKKNREYGDRHTKDWQRAYNQTPKRKQYLLQWRLNNKNWIRDYWRKKRLPKKEAKTFTREYISRLESELVWQQ